VRAPHARTTPQTSPSPISQAAFRGVPTPAAAAAAPLPPLPPKGMCKAASRPAVYGKASVRCPTGFTMEKDKMGLIQCVKRTKQACPSGTTLKDGTCCPPDRCEADSGGGCRARRQGGRAWVRTAAGGSQPAAGPCL
jgi:hypothetical protein